MTFKEMIVQYCHERIMSPDQTKSVLKKVIEVLPDMEERIHHETSDYPEVILVIVLNTTQECALEWFD